MLKEPAPDGAAPAAKRNDLPDVCPALAQIVDRIGDRWTVTVLGALSTDSGRFNTLLRRVPVISHRMLTLTLRGLERDGLVRRTVFATIPPEVEYALTPLGKSLLLPIGSLAAWVDVRQSEIAAAQQSFDARTPRS